MGLGETAGWWRSPSAEGGGQDEVTHLQPEVMEAATAGGGGGAPRGCGFLTLTPTLTLTLTLP